jgi:DNA invertase Pin-like site-specific DNA recombinase
VPNAYSYLRFSSGDQIHGDSFRRQTELARAWCAKNDIPLVENYRDLGVSAFRGKNADRGALKAFLDRVEGGAIPVGSYLVVESLDRLSRNDITYALQMFLGLINAGVVVVTLADERLYDREKINDGNFTDLIISLTILSRANEESRMKSSRVSAAWAAKRQKLGEEKMTGMCPGWLELAEDRKAFTPIPARTKVVRRIFEMAAEGIGQNGIAKRLNAEKAPTFRGATRWHISTIKKILDSRAVIGEFCPGKMVEGKRKMLEPVPNYFPTVVPMELFATVQRIRKARPSYRGRTTENPLVGVVYNEMTGNRMIRLTKGAKAANVYLVDAAAPTGAAPYISWRFDEFLNACLVCCRAATSAPAMPRRENPELTAALRELDEIEGQIPRLVEFIANGFSESVDQKLRELESRKKQVAKKIVELRTEEQAERIHKEEIDWADTERLKQNIRAVVKRITVHPKDRWFRVELFDGRSVLYREDGGDVVIESEEEAPAFVLT